MKKMLLLIFSMLFLLTFGYDETIECDLYNQRYPNLTLTKVYSENTTTTCSDICIQYICPINFFNPNNNQKVYVMGSGCREDIRKNCETYIDFSVKPHCHYSTSMIFCICVNKDGKPDCSPSLSSWVEKVKKIEGNFSFGWDHFSDIVYEPGVDGVVTFNESLNTIYPVTTTTPFINPSTSTTTQLSNGGQSFIFTKTNFSIYFLFIIFKF